MSHPAARPRPSRRPKPQTQPAPSPKPSPPNSPPLTQSSIVTACRYVNFHTNQAKVRQLLAAAEWANRPTDLSALLAWLQQHVAVTLHALLLELHLNGTPHLWKTIARYTRADHVHP